MMETLSRTHCTLGHEYTIENTYCNASGGPICRTCDNARKRARYRRIHPEVKHRLDGTFQHGTYNGYSNRGCRCDECRIAHTIYRKERYDNNKDQYHNWRLKSRYGITLKERNNILDLQGGGCAVCNAKENPEGRMFHTDHDHTTGRVRGILCGHCNAALGYVREDEEIVEGLLKYIKEIKK